MPEYKAIATSSSQVTVTSSPWWMKVCYWLWRGLRYVWGTLIADIFIGTIANVNTTSTETLPSKLYIISLAQTFPLLVYSSLGILMLLTLLSWLGSRGKDATPARTLSQQERTHMLGRLRLRYEQMRTQSLQGMVRMELGVTSRPTAVHNAVSLSLRLPDQLEQPLSSHLSIVDAYEQAQQELLILGEPGSGKSTLLLDLAHHLVEQSEQDASQPLPILLPLSSWATSHRPLQDWLSEQVAVLYDVHPSLSQQWVQTQQLYFLLDGLDEMEESARAACITAINTYHREYVQPLVVCSRTNEYDASSTHERLVLNTAVVLQPLSLKRVDTYLETLGKPLAALRAALKKNTVLAEMAMTPLMVQVLILTYHGISVRVLSHKEAQLRQQIWNDYVQRMVSRKGDARSYPLSVTLTWLGWLAQEMRKRNLTIFFLEQLQPDWLSKGKRTLYRWSVG